MRIAKYLIGGVLVVALSFTAAVFLLLAEAITYVNEGTRFANPLQVPPWAASRSEGGFWSSGRSPVTFQSSGGSRGHRLHRRTDR